MSTKYEIGVHRSKSYEKLLDWRGFEDRVLARDSLHTMWCSKGEVSKHRVVTSSPKIITRS